MNTTNKGLKVFYPSTNIIRDKKRSQDYIVTENAKQIFYQLINNYKTGSRAFNIIGAYGTGKSSFLLAFENELNTNQCFFSDSHFNTEPFEIINIIGTGESLVETFAELLGVEKNKKLHSKQVLAKLNSHYLTLQKKGKRLLIVIDEFGKFLEYASKNNPETELYFIQQLAEFANDISKEILLITTLHQDFNEYSKNLSKAQTNEWDKVKGRLKEITFNEPVEQLLLLAATQISSLGNENKNKNFSDLFKCIEKSKAFPLKDYFNVSIAEKLLPFDILSASVLTLALQKYGQNERSLFSFIYSNDPLSLTDYAKEQNPYYNISCVYDYLIRNFYSFLTTRNPTNYTQWNAIRIACERVEGTLLERIPEAVQIVKVIGMLNIFSSAAIQLDLDFLKKYSLYSLGIKNAEEIIKSLETVKIIRFGHYNKRYILFEGTDLDIEMAINKAGHLVEKVTNVVHRLNQYFDFPYVSAKAIHYEIGTPRYFSFKLTDTPISNSAAGEIDGYINLIFSDTIEEAEIIQASLLTNEAILFGWYQNNSEIRNLLFEIDKIQRVKENHLDDRVACRELDNILQFQVKLLNHFILGGLYNHTANLKWFYGGVEKIITDRKSFNKLLSNICRTVYHKTPAYKNEMINKTKLSSPMQSARRNLVKALVSDWDKENLGLDSNRFPPEKTIYLSLLRETGMHYAENGIYNLGKPLKGEFNLDFIWNECEIFLQNTQNGKRNLQELTRILSCKPFKLKQGFIDFWLPIFLFIKRDDFALFGRNGYIPYLSQETLELVNKNPKDFEIKAFNIDGIKLNLFNGYRILLNQSTQTKITNKIFIDTIRPFLSFYKSLPEYAKNTTSLDKKTLALRNAIALSKDPEESFFLHFPKAMGYDIVELEKNPKLLKEYSENFQKSIKEIRNCYDELIDRVETFILQNILGEIITFPNYRTSLQIRYKNLKKYLLLPHQKSFFQRLYSETEDRKAWINSLTQACLNKPLEIINDNEEQILFERFYSIFRELDNLIDIDNATGFNLEKEWAFKFEMTSFVEGLKKNLIRIPKSKTIQMGKLKSEIEGSLSTDKQLNIATLAKMLEELLYNEN